MKMKKGFTLIEIMVVIAIIGILIAVVVGGIKHKNTQCIGGYLFTNPMQLDYSHPTTPVQVLDERGNGIRCTAEQQ